MIKKKGNLKEKDKIKNFINETKRILKENPLLICYIGGSVLNGLIVQWFTIKQWFSLSPFLADLFITLLFTCIYFLIKEKRRNTYLLFCTILSTIICMANVVYYFYYSSFISVTFISFALTNTETGNSNVLGGIWQFKFFLFLWFPIFMFVMSKIFNHKELKLTLSRNKKYSQNIFYWALIIFLCLVTTLKGVDYSRLYKVWNREYIVSRFGVYLYQINDLIKSIEPQMAGLFGSDQANKEINEYYKENTNKQTNNKYTDIFKGKNVIAIHAESMQLLAMKQIFNGQEVTPNLNRLANSGLFFSNYYSQVSIGTSSDTEFTIATSLMPAKSGTAFINYADKTYVSFYKLLEEQGYYTASMHANTGNFWNRNIMYKSLGYNDFYDKESYDIDETIGFGLSDKSFILQSVEKIKKISEEHNKFYTTLITLSNHTPFDEIDKYGDFDVSLTINGTTYSYMEGTQLGNYFKSVHYADMQLGLLIKSLEDEGLLDNTIIVIYGDHDARISKNLWNRLYNYDYTTNSVKSSDDEDYIDTDYYWYEINRRVPLIIWSNDSDFQKNYSAEITKAMGMIDLSPTLGNMLGVYNKYALGHDIFSIDNNVVVFPNGNFVTDKVYYNDSKGEYKLLEDIPLDTNYIEKNKEYSRKFLDVSNNIIVYNYFKKELSTERYEEE